MNRAAATAAPAMPGAEELARVSDELGHDAPALTAWALGLGQRLGLRAIVTTNFRPFEAVILHNFYKMIFRYKFIQARWQKPLFMLIVRLECDFIAYSSAHT